MTDPDPEPVFTIGAHDTLAPLIVAIWCELALLHGCAAETYDAGYVVRDRMLGWQADHGSQWPA